jgi:predicted acylesterase/phospholipase RssA
MSRRKARAHKAAPKRSARRAAAPARRRAPAPRPASAPGRRLATPRSDRPRKRALILAGGGIKVGFQAGVLEVWLDEAGLTFDHADGASGGCLNLAMYCQGMTGRQMADNWRNLDPFIQVDLNWEHYWKLASAPSLFTLDNFRKHVLPGWGIDWKKIRASPRLGTFNICNFSTKELEVVTNDRMTEDWLIASISLPMWFPPVRMNGQTYLDSVYLTDANVEEAIRRGADEIWAIWTVSTKDEWHDGFVPQYFQIIEIAANGRFFPVWRRIEASNREIAAGRTGEFGRPITLKLLQAEVPIHYLINFSHDRMVECVNLGVKTAREWCAREGIPLPHRRDDTPAVAPSQVKKLQFTEEMKGHVTEGEADHERGARAPGRQPCMFRLTIKVDDVDRFLSSPDHEARAEGWVEHGPLGGRRPVERGVFNLLTHTTDPAQKQMLYRLFFSDAGGRPYTLSGRKDVRDQPGLDVWSDTTTLYTRIYPGHVTAGEEAALTPYGAGILIIYELDFLKQLGTFRVEGPTPKARLEALTRFGMLFLGKLWDVYGRRFLTSGPI